MKIFCAVEVEPYPGNRLWQNNMVSALTSLGHDVISFRYDIDVFYKHADLHNPGQNAWVMRHRPALEKELLKQIDASHAQKPIDVFFSYFYSAHCTPGTIAAIRQRGIKTVNWYCNASYQFDLVSELAPAYGLCLVPEKERIDDYRKVGAHPLYCQEAANPDFYKDLGLMRDLGAVFIGANFANRTAYCRNLYEAGLPIDVWGNAWTNPGGPLNVKKILRLVKRQVERWKGKPYLPFRICHGFCSDRELVRIYNRAKIALGFGVQPTKTFEQKPIYQVRLRDFEAPMCGTFYLTEHQDELREFFRIGEEIETFHSREELVDKVRFFLAHEEAREKIRRAGFERARRDHTWQIRLSGALSQLS